MQPGTWMVYGAYGYTGRLIVAEAVSRGYRPIVAGRNAEQVESVAQAYNLEARVVSLDDAGALRHALRDVDVVVHAAGPFVRTAMPMVEACLATQTHYVDITGEISVFEQIFARDEEARQAGVALLPGSGFDVVPSDCLAAYVASKIEQPIALEIGIAALSRTSPGTAQTMIEHVPQGNLVRRDGVLVRVPFGTLTRTIHFSDKPRQAVAIPWGDLATAYRSTGIPNITTYMAFPPAMIRQMRFLSWLAPLFRIGAVRRAVQAWIRRSVKGPDEQLLARGRSYLWAQVRNAAGETAEAWLETCEGYRFTALAVVAVVERLAETTVQGALTPAQAFGADFVLEIDETRRFDQIERTKS
ncbi:hypothetical protein ARMA_1626 [Ardenticatena maritima]|uniref:Saccharopine dehydrogenase NADP binding domain-containing protein n=1 Tax=Ardenticatena maritima TaxID=872965 RepID=A0A0M8K766_9CHLR|nr:saccharopine dehydrogenase NADP-binding domain-containing protein [Ardenticatena maritima]KPL88531.1 hypothetical protein SE16_07040 [Ardenticatena maritima]GAP63203.1 hypothetical protein ARMA_1626 [Ardenticatena maritima]